MLLPFLEDQYLLFFLQFYDICLYFRLLSGFSIKAYYFALLSFNYRHRVFVELLVTSL